MPDSKNKWPVPNGNHIVQSTFKHKLQVTTNHNSIE
jgi:hypothetical protein